MSAWNCMSRLFCTMPPSARRLGEGDAGILFHGVEHLAGLEGGGFQHGAGEVRFVDVAGQSGDDAAGDVFQYGA